MAIVYCRSCAKELFDTQAICEQCGAPQARVLRLADAPAASDKPVRSIGRWLLAVVFTGVTIVVAAMAWPVFDALH